MIGVDIGGTKIKLGQVEQGRIGRSLSIDTPVGAPPARMFDLLAEAVRELDPAPRTLGVAIPGEVNSTGRIWRLPNLPGFEGVSIATELSTRTGARVVVENDGTTAAFGEALFGRGRDNPSFLMVTLGTGVGGGLVVGRHVVRGAHGFAAEIGHVTVDPSPDAWPCVCGSHGCLEVFAGTHALLRKFREAGGTATEVVQIAASARRGEPAGLATFAMMAQALGIALNSIQNILDLDAIVFTGGISRSLDLIEPRVRAELRARRFAEPLGEVPLLESELGDHAGVIGAAYLPELDAR